MSVAAALLLRAETAKVWRWPPGKWSTATPPAHHVQFLAVLQQIAEASSRMPLRVVVDNYATHNHPKITAWLTRKPAGHPAHFTATSGSWLHLVEVFLGRSSGRVFAAARLSRSKGSRPKGSRYRDRHLHRRPERALQPFVWTNTAEEVLARA